MKARTLIFSLRKLRKDICRCHDYEVEDVTAGIDSVDFYEPSLKYRNPLLSDLAQYISYKTLRLPVNTAFRFPRLEGTYDLFLANMTFSYDLEILHRMPDWKNRVGYSICYLDELFTESLTKFSQYIPILRRFDCVALNCSGTVEALMNKIGVKTIPVPTGIDTLRFYPGPRDAPRKIDLYNMGRRDPQQHREFQRLQNEHDWIYLYDTIAPESVPDFNAHRDNLAGLLKCSRHFIVNPAKFDIPEDTGYQEETGFRYFEGASAGCVLTGRIPKNPNFKKVFPWKEPVIELPENHGEIADFMLDLQSQEERLRQVTYDNVLGSLKMHDFAYRWEEILQTAGLDPLPALAERKERLQELQEEWSGFHKKG